MGLENLSPGAKVPEDINVIIEIPSKGTPVKYEIDKKSGMVMVDRFLSTSMIYPCEYGFIPHTLSEDGDPLDVLVVSPFPLLPGVVVRCRPVGMLRMTDDSGKDTKILAVPVDKLAPTYQYVKQLEDLGQPLLNSIEHFFKHYKDLEKGKWTKIDSWEQAEAAKKEIVDSITRYNNETH